MKHLGKDIIDRPLNFESSINKSEKVINNLKNKELLHSIKNSDKHFITL